MHITALYAAIAALLLVTLAIRVTLHRRSAKIGIGDGGDIELSKRVRAHGNAAEFLPIGLLLLLLLEMGQTRPLIVHIFGILFVFGRFAHAFGLSTSTVVSPGRAIGTVLTYGTMLAMALLLLWQWIVIHLAAA